jgi:hypothetical protein
MTEETAQIDLPKSTLEGVTARLDDTEFEDESAYIAHVLDELLYYLEREELGGRKCADQSTQERLRSLGYME